MSYLNPNSIHLLNRATFGPKIEWLSSNNKIIMEDLEKTQQWLFDTISEYHPIHENNNHSFIFEEEKKENDRVREGAQVEGLIFDWVSKMVSSSNPLREIVALFWHHHIPCVGRGNLETAKLLLEIYRKDGLGKLNPLIKNISSNPAMMYYLSANFSRKDKPTENFPRELMEIFLLGEGHYSYKDVKEVSRAFTGRRTDESKYPFKMYIKESEFDSSNKTLFGETGNWDGDDVIDIIIKQYQTARHISRSALIFFLGQVPSNEFLDECASVYYNSEYNFQSLLKQIFCSSMFYSPNYLNNKVKTPVELLVGLSRKTGMRCIGVKTTNFFLQLCGQRLFSPPSVVGWPVGNEWLLGQNLVNRLFLPDVVLKIANRSCKKDSIRFKIINKANPELRYFRYSWDSSFDRKSFEKILEKNKILHSSWMLNLKVDNQDLSKIVIRPEFQYS